MMPICVWQLAKSVLGSRTPVCPSNRSHSTALADGPLVPSRYSTSSLEVGTAVAR